MTDIVERLRNRNNPENRWVMMTEAADEIELLRSTTEISPVHVQELQADNARLRAISAELCGAMDDCITWLSSGFAPQSQSRALERAAKAKAAFRALEPKP